MEENVNPKKKKNFAPYILAGVLVIAAIFGIVKYNYAMHHENTDDAQLETDISPVLPRTSGYITEINFEDNQKVTAGQILIKLDENDLRLKVDQAQAALDNAIANEAVIRANVGSSSAVVATSKSSIAPAKIRLWKATQDYDRYKKLLADKAVTQSQFDAIKAEMESAQSAVEVAEKQEEAAGSQESATSVQIKVAQSVIAQRKADLDYAKLQLSYAVIKAPVSGIVSKKSVQIGQFVQAGQPLVSIVSDSSIWVVANFKETQLEKMKPGQKVEVEVDAFKDRMLNAEVSSFSAATGARFSLLPPDNATGNFVKVVQRLPVKIKFHEDAKTMSMLRPGMSVKVTVDLDNK